jgi:cyclopropane-fatty-acyl-phospholipid synthase
MSNTNKLKQKLQMLLQPAGITINGTAPFDPQVHDDRFYARVIAGGSLGLGEAYMDGWFDVAEPDQFFYRILHFGLDDSFRSSDIPDLIRSVFINGQSRIRSREIAEKHYNLSPELYMSFLDPYNQYTCCYFPEGNETLNEAAIKKLHLICRKLQLKPGDTVLDIGCGWSGFARFAAEHYGCTVTGISIAEEQIIYARNFANGLPVNFVLSDYRDITGVYDKILICGMIEHAGFKNYKTLMQVVSRSLAPGGLFLLQTIGRNDTSVSGDKWIRKYIFPNSQLPSIKQISSSVEHLFVVEDWHNFGAHYDHTLMAWHNNFVNNWPELTVEHPEYDTRFFRMWTYYLLSCAGAFRARNIQLWQVVFTKSGITGGYTSVR